MLQEALVEEDFHKARAKGKIEIVRALAGETESKDTDSIVPEIVYDEEGKPRPGRIAYDDVLSDDPPPRPRRPTVVEPLPPETVPADDFDNPFPGLDPPLG